jgi:type IV pilus assembly protein PilW
MPSSMNPSRRQQRGLSLVEMMVGVTVGLFVVAAASVLVVSQLGENRRLLLETQVQQDLRATADIVTRDLRRAGYNVNSLNNIWLPDQPNQPPLENSWALLDLSDPGAPAYRYTRVSEQAFQLSLDGGTVYRKIGNAPRQPLTDRSTLEVTTFTVAEAPDFLLARTLACPSLCPDGSQDCWPRMSVRDLLIDIRGRAVSDASVERRLQSRVRLRNDAVKFNAAGGQVCP